MQPLLPGQGSIPGVPFTQPRNVFRYGEISIWSSQLLAAGTAIANTQNRLFTVAQSQQGQGFTNALTITETNLKEGGRVPAGVAYDVFGVATQVMFTTSTADAGTISQSAVVNGAAGNNLSGAITNIVNNGVLSWDFTQTQVDICPVMLAGAGGGVFGVAATADSGTPVTVGGLSNGNGSIWMYKKHPVALPGTSTFAILLRFGSRAAAIPAAQGAVVRVVLLGLYKNIIEIG